MSHAVDIDPNSAPGLAPPAGQTNNLDNPYSLQNYTSATAGVTVSLSTIAVLLRVFMKARVLRRVQLEEYILILSLIGLYTFTGFIIQAVHMGQGTHQWNVSVGHVQSVIKLANILEIIYCPTILGAKVALLLQMKRMFVVGKYGKLYWLHEILLWTNVPCYLAIMLSFALACIPREKLWNPELPGRCISSTGSLIASSALNVLSDMTILLLPLTVIMRLRLPPKSKLILGVVFGTGVLGCISSVFRLIYSILLTRTGDFTWGIAPVGHWALGEICSAILSGAIPMLPGFFKFVRGRSTSQSPPTYGNTSSCTRRGRSTRTEPKGAAITDPSANDLHNCYYEMGVINDAHVSAASLLNPDEERNSRSGIMKTIHVQTEYIHT
ncbi:hypothetical protein P175DRAFT_0557941 [Aspergillus ochraceoroseus IBT 24754]|uniref:Rhodopsin domain-containing protein n=2 Tax=Aspergillus ochraceoroseus TaxID=138278 RepID=A0A2T5LYB2_9EURO|nr:uncharacterized protein P175DRAFT_0557941 [Aspergillus ochraceoroseus IBT 24754]KKK24235.1 hypothetical protein AOCH_001404 [Aspergillus ochraceoroseus]PTU21280.1 hypothetical protein P175DRAFT_0557941 [Aspergillus ochraceoroseus IBT 24754]